MSAKKQRKRRTDTKNSKSAGEMPKIDEMIKSLGKGGLKDALEPEKIKEMISQFSKENMNEIITNLVGPDKEAVKEMIEQQIGDRPQQNPNRFGNAGNVGAVSGTDGPGRNEARVRHQQRTQQQRREQMESLAEKATTLTCTSCSGHFFDTIFVVKRVSPLVSPSGEEMIIPVQTFRCTECGNVNESFLPNNILNDMEKKD